MWRLVFMFLPMAAQACDRPVCEVGAETVAFARIVTFDDQASGYGPGRPAPDVIRMDGVSFGEHFAGQTLDRVDDFDRVTGRALEPLTIRPGVTSQNLTIIRLADTNVLSGYGPTGYPNHSATGEGAIAVMFDEGQPGIGFDLRGGEGGYATVVFLNRGGEVIDTHLVGPLAEISYAFRRQGDQRDIVGVVITNEDPDGIALDQVAFEAFEQLS
ncbi:hypothetical protein [Yoonia sp. R2-816]|uniref:hypothetical protein n=1 Tax=Yoonia sp. R2-816 TaxID=3342638 RepID=UPI00372AA133